ncbi:unnamed protein product [Sphagnum balticum]
MKMLMPSLYGHCLHGIVPALIGTSGHKKNQASTLDSLVLWVLQVFELQNASCNFDICIRFSFAAVVGFALRASKEGLEAGTKLVHVHSLPQFLCMPQISALVLAKGCT